MTAPTPEEIALIKQFEPILFCAPGERFFPSDAKRYVERCALYRATVPAFPSVTPPATWDPDPALPADTIVAVQSEAGGGTTFLGRKVGLVDEFLQEPSTEEFFFSLFGWRESDDPSTAEAYANIEAIAQAYQHGTLKDSRFWYHAEFFKTEQLKTLFAAELARTGLDFSVLLKPPTETTPPVFRNPALICYYLFFPAHEEGLPDCNSVATAQLYANYAGDWACVALLLDRPTAAFPYTPQFAGLTNRNIGVVQRPGGEIRVGMRVLHWDELVKEDTDHPRLNVAKGTHGLYRDGEGGNPVTPFTPDDLTRNACGQSPAFAPFGEITGATTPGLLVAATVVGVIKIFVSGGFAWMMGLAVAFGSAAGALWNVLEGQPHPAPAPASPTPPPSPGPIVDTVTPDPVSGGMVIHPLGLVLAGIAAANRAAWPAGDRPPPPQPDNRSYSPYVDRDAAVLWGGEPSLRGFKGRWGPRVNDDAGLRRSGMLFPNFWSMFFVALVTRDPPDAAPVQVLIDAAEGDPIGNATNNAGLAAAYDGNTGKTWDQSPTGDSPLGVFIGKRFATKHLISGIKIWLSSDLGFNSNNPDLRRKFTVFGKSGADPNDPRDGDVLFVYEAGLPDIAGYSLAQISGFNMAATHDRVWVTLDNDPGDGLAVFTQVQWFKTI